MIHRPFGKAGFDVSVLGFGAGHIGDPAMSEDRVAKLLHDALDLGITLFDTARGYGCSEERIGRHLSGVRDRIILSTKVGYGIQGFSDWTGPIIGAGVREALRLLKTDRIDIVHLHSCPKDTLLRGEVVAALDDEVRAGRVRVAAYSGENDALFHALTENRFRSVQFSLNVCDQRSIDLALPKARERGLGVIAKRPLANVPWRFAERPTGQYAEVYWDRLKAMNLDPRGLPWNDVALRFAAFQDGVSSCIAGTSNADHLKALAAALDAGPLAPDHVATIRDAFRRCARDWVGQV